MWCPFGEAIGLETLEPWSSNPRSGFLGTPEGSFNSNCKTLEELCDQYRALVLCGPPGTGKSVEIYDYCQRLKEDKEVCLFAYGADAIDGSEAWRKITIEHPEWKKAQLESRKIVLVIDGFDQIRLQPANAFKVLSLMLRDCDLTNVRLIVGCRTSDWNEIVAESLLSRWGQASTEGVFEICPLQRRDVVEAATSMGVGNPEEFLDAIREMRAEVHAHWPLTLEPLLHRHVNGRDLSDSAKELYSDSVARLLESARDEQTDPSLSATTVRQIARRIAALQVFKQSQSIQLSVDLPSRDELTSSEIIGPEGEQMEWSATTGVPFELNLRQIKHVVGTGLFTAHGVKNRGFVHQAYAEFLAAEYVKGLSVLALKELLTVRISHRQAVPPQLTETAAWVSVINEKWFQWLLENSPQILLRADGAQLPASQKSELLRRLLAKVSSYDALPFQEINRLTPSFGFPGMASHLSHVIRDPSADSSVRQFAIQVAEKCRLLEVEPALWELLERGGDETLRRRVYYALSVLLPLHDKLGMETLARLDRLVRKEMGSDDEDDLKGLALEQLVPGYRKVSDIAEWLTPPVFDNYTGAYERFLRSKLPRILSRSDVPVLLSRIAANRWCSSRSGHRQLAKAVVCEAMNQLNEVATRQAMIALIESCILHSIRLPFSDDPSQEEESPNEQWQMRVDLLHLYLNEGPSSAEEVWSVKEMLGLRHVPLSLLLDEFEAAPMTSRPHWAECIRLSIFDEEDRRSVLPRLLDVYANHSELRDAMLPCRPGLNIHETLVAHREEQRAKQRSFAREIADAGADEMTVDGIRLAIGLLSGGRFDKLYNVLHWLYGSDDGLVRDVVNSQRWNGLLEKEHRLVFDAARTWLAISTDPKRSEKVWRNTHGSHAACLSLGLLADELEGDEDLARHAARNWTRAFILEPRNHSPGDLKVATALLKHNPAGVLSALLERLEGDSALGSNASALRYFEHCWSPEISSTVVSFLNRSDIHPATYRSVCRFLASVDFASAKSMLASQLLLIPMGQDFEQSALQRVVIFCAAFRTQGQLWGQAALHFQPLENARKILEENAGAFDSWHRGRDPKNELLQGLGLDELEQLYIWLARIYPESESTIGKRFLSGSDTMAEVRDLVERTYTAFPVPEDRYKKVMAQLSQSLRESFAFSRGSALLSSAESEFRPIPSAALLKLVRLSDARLIRCEEDLLDFCIERIKRFESESNELRRDYLWINDKSEKHETDLSKALTGWLRDSRELIANCEVQSVTNLSDRTDIIVQLGHMKPVVIEVKKAHNPKVQTDIQTQLVDRYLPQHQTPFGLYVVGWYGHMPSCLGGETTRQDEKNLQKLVRKLTGPAELQVRAMVLDCRRRATTPKRKVVRKSAVKAGRSRRTVPKL